MVFLSRVAFCSFNSRRSFSLETPLPTDFFPYSPLSFEVVSSDFVLVFPCSLYFSGVRCIDFGRSLFLENDPIGMFRLILGRNLLMIVLWFVLSVSIRAFRLRTTIVPKCYPIHIGLMFTSPNAPSSLLIGLFCWVKRTLRMLSTRL